MIPISRFLFILSLASHIVLGSQLLVYAADQEEDYNRVVLKVNGLETRKWEMDINAVLTKETLFSENGGALSHEVPAFKEAMMESTITTMLYFQEALKEGVTVEDEEAAEFIWLIQKRFPSREAYISFMDEFHVPEDQTIPMAKRFLVTTKYLDQKFGPSAQVPEDEARAYYDAHLENFRHPDLARASHILFRYPERENRHNATLLKKKAQRILNRLKAGEHFSTMARNYSEDPSHKWGGDLGYFERGDLAKIRLKPLEEEIFSMKVGEISGPVETVYGFHLVFLEDKKSSEIYPFEIIKDRLMKKMSADRLNMMLREHAHELKKNATIERFP